MAFSPLYESADPVDIFGTLELVYFSISKKSRMTVVFLFRNFLDDLYPRGPLICPGIFLHP